MQKAQNNIVKSCSKCKTIYSGDLSLYFHKDNTVKDKLKARCKKCLNKSRVKVKKRKRELTASEKQRRNRKKTVHRRLSPANYESYYHKLQIAEWIQKDENGKLRVKCTNCGEIMIPTINAVKSRIRCLEGKQTGEARFYCSQECKDLCPIYNQSKYPKDFDYTKETRDVAQQILDEVKARDNYMCQDCKAEDGRDIEVHHILPYTQNPALGNDKDNLITLCEGCHKIRHSVDGMKYGQLACNMPHNIQTFQEIPYWGAVQYNNYQMGA